MKLFKNSAGARWAFEDDGSQDHLITMDMMPISEEEAQEIESQRQLETFNRMSYAAKREAAYPPITDYLDGVVKGDQGQIAKYIADCLAVKANFPKG